MDGTRVARVSALSAALLLGLALAATSLLDTVPAGALRGGAGTAALTDRTPVLLRSVERGASDGVPRTTPPPTPPVPSATGAPAAAETVDSVRQT